LKYAALVRGEARMRLQTHGSRANWHPHLHLLVTDGKSA
jgi:hypothetical protein